MPQRRRAWLTREGWYYSTVLAFIIGGATLRSVNLLVILAGMMIATLIINWRLVMASLNGLMVERKLPQQVLGGEPLVVEITAHNNRWWMSSWLVTVEDRVERLEAEPAGATEHQPRSMAATRHGSGSGMESKLENSARRWFSLWRFTRETAAHASAVITHVPAHGRASGAYRITLHRRGRYRFGPLRVSTSFPLGLVRGQVTVPQEGELIVAPRLGRFTPRWASLLEAEMVGDYRRHPQRGLSDGDYYGLRPWQSGDSMRWIHWRTAAKLGRPVVRQYERRRSRDVVLILDPWLDDPVREQAAGAEGNYPGQAARSGWCAAAPRKEAEERKQQAAGYAELAISLAATALADITGRGQTRLTFAIAGMEPECFSGPCSPLFCQEVLARLAVLVPGRQSTLPQTLEQALAESVAGARVIVITSRPANDPSLAETSAELPLDPEDLVWIDASSNEVSLLFMLE